MNAIAMLLRCRLHQVGEFTVEELGQLAPFTSRPGEMHQRGDFIPASDTGIEGAAPIFDHVLDVAY